MFSEIWVFKKITGLIANCTNFFLFLSPILPWPQFPPEILSLNITLQIRTSIAQTLFFWLKNKMTAFPSVGYVSERVAFKKGTSNQFWLI